MGPLALCIRGSVDPWLCGYVRAAAACYTVQKPDLGKKVLGGSGVVFPYIFRKIKKLSNNYTREKESRPRHLRLYFG
jgi:hypothetical protein